MTISGSVTWLCLLAVGTVCLAQQQHYETFNPYSSLQRPVSAVADIYGTTKFPNIRGQLRFEQPTTGGPVIVRGTVLGLTPGLHGLHIHTNGNLTDDCKAAGPHFNPFNKDHGAQDADVRHVGDLGNLEALDVYYPASATVAEIYLIDHVISLSTVAEHGVLYRAVVVHEKADDLGLGSHEDSKKTGNSGDRVACGVITLVPPPSY